MQFWQSSHRRGNYPFLKKRWASKHLWRDGFSDNWRAGWWHCDNGTLGTCNGSLSLFSLSSLLSYISLLSILFFLSPFLFLSPLISLLSISLALSLTSSLLSILYIFYISLHSLSLLSMFLSIYILDLSYLISSLFHLFSCALSYMLRVRRSASRQTTWLSPWLSSSRYCSRVLDGPKGDIRENWLVLFIYFRFPLGVSHPSTTIEDGKY